MQTETPTKALAGFVDVPVEQLANLTRDQRAYLIECFIMVKEPVSGQPVPLIPNQMQRHIFDTLEDYEITVKWRRGGLTSAYVATAWMNILTRPGWSVELFAHDWATAKAIFDDVIMFQYKNLPPEFRPEPSAQGAGYIEFEQIDSRFRVGTAGQSEAVADKKGQARTINELILTEYARYAHAETFMGTVLNCVPPQGGIVRIDSTPNGQNSFYSRFKKASAGLGDYRARFFPWWWGETTRLDLEPDEPLDNLHHQGPITDEEARLGHGNPFADSRLGPDRLTPEQIKWRRWKLENIEPLGSLTAVDRFRVEYPEDSESCFLQSGRPVIRMSDLIVRCDELDKGREMIELSRGGEPVIDPRTGQPRLTGEKHQHVIGMDTSTGDSSGHPAGICVIDIDTTPCEQVYEWIGWEPTDSQAERLVEVQERFPGILVVERNTPGDSVLQLLRRWDVDGIYKHREKELKENMGKEYRLKPGFPTSSATKPRMFVQLEQALRHGDLILSGPETIADLKGMQYDDDDKIVYNPAFETGTRGIITHGELAIAVALAWYGRRAGGAGVA